MTKRISIWLTDEEEALLVARRPDLKPHELATLLLCKWLGSEVGDKKKAQRKFLAEHEAVTRAEQFRGGRDYSLRDRLAELLREADGPLSTTELREALGLKKGPHTELSDWPSLFRKVPPPARALENRKRGRQPIFWELVDPSNPISS